jgi:hypothetical protein
MRVRALAPWVATIAILSGCAGRTPETAWGARWPSGGELAEAAVSAARSPATWAPLAGAAVLSIGDLDEDLSDWGADHQPLFGADAAPASDDLRSAAKAAWLITALATPSENLTGKAGGLAVGAATLLLEDAVTDAIKNTAHRRRPDGSDDRSFSSGHAGTASAAATLARRNLDYLAVAPWLDATLRVGFHGIAFGTGWARVEAQKHHVTDVLAGYAVGHFLAAFMHETFMRSAASPMQVHFRPLGDGGALTVVFIEPQWRRP